MYYRARFHTWVWVFCSFFLAILISFGLGCVATCLPHIDENSQEAITHTIAFTQTIIGICSITAIFTFLHKSLRISIKKCLKDLSYPDKEIIDDSSEEELPENGSEKKKNLYEDIKAIRLSVKRNLDNDIYIVSYSKSRSYMWRSVIILSIFMLVGLGFIYTGKSNCICYTNWGWFMLIPILYALIGYRAISSSWYWTIKFDNATQETLAALRDKIKAAHGDNERATENFIHKIEKAVNEPTKVHVVVIK